MAAMFSVLKRLSDQGKLTEALKNNAIAIGWITAEEAQTL